MTIEDQFKLDKVFLKLSIKHAVLSLLRQSFLILREILSMLLLIAKRKQNFPMLVYFE